MNTKPAYQCDLAGLFAGVTVADESPLEPGVFLLPAGCTFTPPPDDVPDEKWPRWNGVVWELVNRPKPPAPADPLAKLQAFLTANPDVADLLDKGEGSPQQSG